MFSLYFLMNMNDDFIKEKLLDNANRVKQNKTDIIEKYNLKDYIINRFDDSESFEESLYRILKGINKGICPICGNKTKFCYPNGGRYYNKYCSIECMNKGRNMSIDKKHLSKMLSKSWNNKTDSEKKEIRKKIKDTCNIKYGVGISIEPNKNKKHMMEKYGVENPSQLKNRNIDWKKAVERQYKTKKKNNTFNISKPEEETYKLLKEKYPNIIRQYKSELYPFNCDFYIPNYNDNKIDSGLYIEYNGIWTHSDHPYNEYNKEDQFLLKKWKEKNTKYYDNAIKIWTVKDPLKRKTAHKNNINYIEFWNLNDVKFFLNNVSNYYRK